MDVEVVEVVCMRLCLCVCIIMVVPACVCMQVQPPWQVLQCWSGPQVTSCLGDRLEETHDEDSCGLSMESGLTYTVYESDQSLGSATTNMDRDSLSEDEVDDLQFLVDSNSRSHNSIILVMHLSVPFLLFYREEQKSFFLFLSAVFVCFSIFILNYTVEGK